MTRANSDETRLGVCQHQGDSDQIWAGCRALPVGFSAGLDALMSHPFDLYREHCLANVSAGNLGLMARCRFAMLFLVGSVVRTGRVGRVATLAKDQFWAMPARLVFEPIRLSSGQFAQVFYGIGTAKLEVGVCKWQARFMFVSKARPFREWHRPSARQYTPTLNSCILAVVFLIAMAWESFVDVARPQISLLRCVWVVVVYTSGALSTGTHVSAIAT